MHNSSILGTENSAKDPKSKSDGLKKNGPKGEITTPKKKFTIRDLTFGGLLFFIATGIWGIFLQNMGLIATDDFTQKVRVVNTVNTYSKGGSLDVSVDGEVEAYINNTVDVNMREVNGYDTKSYENGLLGVYNLGN